MLGKIATLRFNFMTSYIFCDDTIEATIFQVFRDDYRKINTYEPYILPHPPNNSADTK
jgi:hypothetical protein